MLSAACVWQSEKLLELRTNCCSHTVCVAAQGDDLCVCALSRLVFALLLLTETLYLPSSFLAVCAQAALDGLWSERTDALQTRSHTLCHFAKRTKKQLGKKRKAFLCILIECTRITCYSKSVALLLLSSHQYETSAGASFVLFQKMVAYKCCCDREQETV